MCHKDRLTLWLPWCVVVLVILSSTVNGGVVYGSDTNLNTYPVSVLDLYQHFQDVLVRRQRQQESSLSQSQVGVSSSASFYQPQAQQSISIPQQTTRIQNLGDGGSNQFLFNGGFSTSINPTVGSSRILSSPSPYYTNQNYNDASTSKIFGQQQQQHQQISYPGLNTIPQHSIGVKVNPKGQPAQQRQFFHQTQPQSSNINTATATSHQQNPTVTRITYLSSIATVGRNFTTPTQIFNKFGPGAYQNQLESQPISSKSTPNNPLNNLLPSTPSTTTFRPVTQPQPRQRRPRPPQVPTTSQPHPEQFHRAILPTPANPTSSSFPSSQVPVGRSLSPYYNSQQAQTQTYYSSDSVVESPAYTHPPIQGPVGIAVLPPSSSYHSSYHSLTQTPTSHPLYSNSLDVEQPLNNYATTGSQNQQNFLNYPYSSQQQQQFQFNPAQQQQQPQFPPGPQHGGFVPSSFPPGPHPHPPGPHPLLPPPPPGHRPPFPEPPPGYPEPENGFNPNHLAPFPEDGPYESEFAHGPSLSPRDEIELEAYRSKRRRNLGQRRRTKLQTKQGEQDGEEEIVLPSSLLNTDEVLKTDPNKPVPDGCAYNTISSSSPNEGQQLDCVGIRKK